MILVTGAAGFIGYHVSQRLLAGGFEVQGLDNLNEYYDPRLKEARLSRLESNRAFKFHRIDLADPHAVAEIFKKHTPESVVHLGAQAGVRYSIKNPKAFIDSNVTGFLNVLEGCKTASVRHLIYASSSSVYGLNTSLPLSTAHCVDHPVSLYGATKKANELMAHSYSHLFNIPTTGLRFFTVYGPWGRPDMAYFTFTKAIFEGSAIKVFNGGRSKRDFTFIDDVVESIIRIIPKPARPYAEWDSTRPKSQFSSAPYRLYNIGNHSPVDLLDFIDLLEESIGQKAKRTLIDAQPGDVVSTYADIADLSNEIDFAPRTPLKVGLGKFVAWYRDYFGVK